MTRDGFAELLLKIQELERAVREDGQKEYAHQLDNCFANFDSDAEHGVSRLQSIMTHLNKHMRGIKAFVNGHRSQREDIRGRIKDARLYMALLWGAVEEELQQAERGLGEFLAKAEIAGVVPRADEHPGWEYGADPLDDERRPVYVTPQPLPVLPRADSMPCPDRGLDL